MDDWKLQSWSRCISGYLLSPSPSLWLTFHPYPLLLYLYHITCSPLTKQVESKMGETQTEFLSGNLEWEHMRESHLMEGKKRKKPNEAEAFWRESLQWGPETPTSSIPRTDTLFLKGLNSTRFEASKNHLIYLDRWCRDILAKPENQYPHRARFPVIGPHRSPNSGKKIK